MCSAGNIVQHRLHERASGKPVEKTGQKKNENLRSSHPLDPGVRGGGGGRLYKEGMNHVRGEIGNRIKAKD